MDKIWANSADSHTLEPHDSVEAAASRSGWPNAPHGPCAMTAARRSTSMARSCAAIPSPSPTLCGRPVPKTSRSASKDLDDQGIWAEVVFPSRGFWISNMTDPELARECSRAFNDWCAEDFMSASPRLVPAAVTSVLDTGDAVGRIQAGGWRWGFRRSTCRHPRRIGRSTPRSGSRYGGRRRGRHPAVLSHRHRIHPARWSRGVRAGRSSTTWRRSFPVSAPSPISSRPEPWTATPAFRCSSPRPGQPGCRPWPTAWRRATASTTCSCVPSSPALPRRPCSRRCTPRSSTIPSALQAVEHMGYGNVMWGSDYPHLEGTFPHTQHVLHGLFDGVARERPASGHRRGVRRALPGAGPATAAR